MPDDIPPASTTIPATIVYAEIDDEVTTLFDRVRRSRGRQVILVIPSSSHILASLVNLKILRYKSETSGREVTIVTKDAAGRQLAGEAGFATAERADVVGRSVKIEKWTPATRADIADVLDGDGEKPTGKIGRRVLSLIETPKKPAPEKIDPEDVPFGAPVASAKRLLKTLAGNAASEPAAASNERFVVRPPNRFAFLLLLAAAAALLFFVVYIAVPTATIYVTPRADPLAKTVNATLTSNATASVSPAGAHIVPAEFFDVTVTRDVRVGATGQVFEGTSAKGTITLFNKSPKEKFLVPSRVLSVRDQLVYRTTQAVTIPRAVGETPGQVDVPVVACEREDLTCDCINKAATCKGAFVGDRGNIKPAYFTLPAIPSLSPALYYAESHVPFIGGVTKVRTFVTKEDLTGVPETVGRSAPELAKAVLAELANEKARTTGRTLIVLGDRQSIKADVVKIATPTNLVDTEMDEFTVQATVRVRGVAYDDAAVRALLLAELQKSVHPDKRLQKIDFDRAALRVENVDLGGNTVKIAIAVEGVEEFNLSEFTEEGARVVSKIRTRVLGKSVDEASAYIRNLPEISRVTISSWPFWAKTVPELPENVKFKLGQ